MDAAQTKESRYVTVGYATLALMYLTMTGMLVSASGWHGLEQATRDFEIIGGTLLLMLGMFFLNLLLALGSWRILTFSHVKRRLFLGASIAVAIIFVVNLIPGLWGWYQGALPPDIGSAAVIGQTVVALGYVLCAHSLAKALSTSNKRLQPDAAEPRA
jgi:hypothetical protein